MSVYELIRSVVVAAAAVVHLMMEGGRKKSPGKALNWRQVIHFSFQVDEASYFIKVIHFTAGETDLKAETF